MAKQSEKINVRFSVFNLKNILEWAGICFIAGMAFVTGGLVVWVFYSEILPKLFL